MLVRFAYARPNKNNESNIYAHWTVYTRLQVGDCSDPLTDRNSVGRSHQPSRSPIIYSQVVLGALGDALYEAILYPGRNLCPKSLVLRNLQRPTIDRVFQKYH